MIKRLVKRIRRRLIVLRELKKIKKDIFKLYDEAVNCKTSINFKIVYGVEKEDYFIHYIRFI